MRYTIANAIMPSTMINSCISDWQGSNYQPKIFYTSAGDSRGVDEELQTLVQFS